MHHLLLWFHDHGLEPKDIATIAVSAVAFMVSFASFVYSVLSKLKEAKKSARSEFTAAIIGMAEVEQVMLTDTTLNTRTRINLTDKRRIFLSNAIFLLKKYRLDASEIEYSLIGMNLSVTGRHGDSLPYYRKGVEVAPSQLTRAWARRSYARALMLAGDSERGRTEFLLASHELHTLEEVKGFDSDGMRYERVETYRRLISTSLQMDNEKYATDDYRELVALTSRITGEGRKNELQKGIADLARDLESRGLIKREIDSADSVDDAVPATVNA
jgi:hypothetical protein